MYEIHTYTLPGTNIHFVTFTIICIEIVIFFYQLMYYFIRPKDLNRLWFLFLLLFLIQYNIVGGLFVDPRLSVPLYTQYFIAFASGIVMSMYFPFYIYKFLNVKELRFFAYYGSIYFLFLPFLVFFVILYHFTNDINLSRKLIVIVPFLYAVAFLYFVVRSLFKYIQNKREEDINFKEKLIGVSFALFFWVGGLPAVVFFNGNQIIEHIVTNTGFLIMTVIFIRSTIKDSKIEYRRLVKSEKELQNINSLLSQKVDERTNEIENLYEQRYNSFIHLAHEIKTPVTLISNYLNDYISNHENSPEISIIDQNVQKLKTDILSFFDLEKFERGELPGYNHSTIVNISNLVLNKQQIFSIYSKKKNIDLSFKVKPDIYIKADINALHSIINNLIENSIKYTPEGGRVIISLDGNKSNIFYSVKDSGYGVPEELHEKIFSPFFQISRNNQENKGYGIGLSIVDIAVKSLGGNITLNSSENKGSEFVIELKRYYLTSDDNPLQIPFEKINLNDEEELHDLIDPSKSASIMIVEDNYDLLRYLHKKLSAFYNVFVAENGRKAIEKLNKIQTPDLIISDVMMNEMDGFEFLKNIRKNEKYKHVPVVFLTAKSTSIDRLEGLSLGAIDYIQKPFLIEELRAKVDSVIKTVKAQKNAILNSAFEYISDKLGKPDPNESKMDNLDQNCLKFNISQREKEIIIFIREGLSYKDIGSKLNISDKTVLKHSQNIFKKVGVNSKNDLISKMFAS